MNCRFCKAELTLISKPYVDYLICEKCYQHFERIDNKQCCKTPDMAYVKHPIRNEALQIRQQCKNCGSLRGRSFSKSNFSLDELPFSDQERNVQYDETLNAEFKELYELGKKNKTDLFFGEYEKYLNSSEWRTKHRLVLERDKDLCQSCFVEKATQVHHLTYDHLYNEPLFDLVSVCAKCHDIITSTDRKEENVAKILHRKMN